MHRIVGVLRFVTGGRLLQAVLALTIAAGGCRIPAPAEKGAMAVRDPALDADSRARAIKPTAAPLDETPIIVDDIAPLQASEVELRTSFPERRVAPTPEVPVAEYPDKLIKGIVDPDKKVPVKLNLDATAMTEVVPMFATLLNFSYLIDPGVKGAVTMQVDTEMTAREAWQMFEHILWLAGAYASKNPGFIHILPFAKMPKERSIFATHDPANVEVAFLPIRYIRSSEIAAQLKTFLTDGASITDVPYENAVLLVEAPANMHKLRELIDRLDTRGEAAWPHVCLPCHHIDCEVLVEELQSILPVLGFPLASGTGKDASGGRIKLTAIPRLQVIVASAALPEVLDEVERWYRVLDQENRGQKESIFFYSIRHSTAEHLSEIIEAFFNTSSTRSSAGAPSRTVSTTAKATPTAGAAEQRRAATRATRRPEGEAEETIFDTPVIVYADSINNRLTIRTTHRAYALVEALLRRQDVPRRQVMIEAAVAEIRLTKSTEFGFAYAATSHVNNVNIKHAAVHTPLFDGSGALLNPASLAEGAAISFMKDADNLAFLRAVAGDSNVRVLSSPQILAANDEKAVINVGARVPVKTGDYTDTSGISTRSTYQYEDTGTILTVTPHITAGNEVRLEVKQEVSSAVPTTTGITDSPTILNKVLETTMMIPDGGTVMMGGLIDTSDSSGDRGVPWLKDVPFMGWFFRTNRREATRTELLVLITVHVVDTVSGTDGLVQRYQEALQTIREGLDR